MLINISVLCAVPLYDSLGEGSVEYITHHAHLKVIFASASKMPLLRKALPKLKGYTKVIVHFGEVDESSPKAVSDQVSLDLQGPPTPLLCHLGSCRAFVRMDQLSLGAMSACKAHMLSL